MFGRKRTDEGLAKAEELGRKIGADAGKYIKDYCAKVVPWAAAGALRQLAANMEGMHGDPMDEENNRRKAQEVALLSANSVNYLGPLEAQLTAQVFELYAFALSDELKALFRTLIAQEFKEQRWKITDAACYVAGLSTAWLRELLGLDEVAI